MVARYYVSSTADNMLWITAVYQLVMWDFDEGYWLTSRCRLSTSRTEFIATASVHNIPTTTIAAYKLNFRTLLAF